MNDRVRAALCGALVALAALLVTREVAVPGLAWNDELVYAAAGRHVADGQGPQSSFYHPDAIVERGLPQPDVHMPGQALLLGAAFRLFGPREGVAVGTSACAFVLAAALVGAACARWGFAAALSAAGLVSLFPPHAAFAHTAMAEPALLLATAAFVAVWLAALERSHAWRAAALAVVLVAGALHRETFLVYAVPAAWAVARWPSRERWRGALAGGTVLAAGGALVLLPLYRARASHPHVLTDALTSGTGLLAVVAGSLRDNVASLPLVPREAWQWVYLLQLLAVVAAAVVAWRARDQRRALAGLAVWGAATTWLGVALVYPLADWRVVRVMMPVVLPALAVVGSALSRARRAAASGLVAVAAVAVAATVSIGRDRRANLEFGRAYAEFLRTALPVGVSVLVATKAYRYGWEAYPVSVVVWEATDLKRVRAVANRLRVDAIVVREEEERRFLNGMEDGAYDCRYALASAAPFHGRYHAYVAREPAGP